MKIFIVKRKLLFLVLAVFWASVIFYFSAKNADDSVEESRTAGKLLCSIFVPGYDDMSEEKQYEMAGEIDYPVRKFAHCAEYAVFGILLAGAIYDARRRMHYNIIVPYAAGLLYAVTDELHQYFVPGRSCRLGDIAIDSMGVILGTAIFLFIVKLHYMLHVCRR